MGILEARTLLDHGLVVNGAAVIAVLATERRKDHWGPEPVERDAGNSVGGFGHRDCQGCSGGCFIVEEVTVVEERELGMSFIGRVPKEKLDQKDRWVESQQIVKRIQKDPKL